MASAYLLVQGRVRVSRRGTVLGEAEPGALVGLEALLSQDPPRPRRRRGHGRAGAAARLRHAARRSWATTFPLVHDGHPCRHPALPRAAGWRPGAAATTSSGLLLPQPAGRRMNLVEVLLFLRTPGGPFERSSIDALAELAGTLTQVPFRRGACLLEGGRARRTHVPGRRGQRGMHVVPGRRAVSLSRGPRPPARGPGSRSLANRAGTTRSRRRPGDPARSRTWRG